VDKPTLVAPPLLTCPLTRTATFRVVSGDINSPIGAFLNDLRGSPAEWNGQGWPGFPLPLHHRQLAKTTTFDTDGNPPSKTLVIIRDEGEISKI